MATRQELLAMLMQGAPNVTTGAANPALRAPAAGGPTGASVDRNQMMAQILSTPVETPRTQPGQIAPVDASMVGALANIGTSIWGARRQKKADAESRELLARELAMSQGKDPFASELQPIVPPSLQGVRPMEGPGAAEASQAQRDGIKPFVQAAEATAANEAPARAEHDLAALLDPRASGLAVSRMAPKPLGDPFTLGPGQTRFDAQGNPIAQGAEQRTATVDGVPMNVKEFEYYKALPDDAARREYLTVKRAIQIEDVEGAPNVVTGVGGTASAAPLAGGTREEATQREIDAAAARAEAEKAAQESASTAAIPERARVESQAEDFAQAPLRLQAARDLTHQVQQLDPIFDRVLENAGAWTVGFGAMVKPAGSPAANMAADLQTLGANAAFDRLQQMRDNSPTGGALGAISERELGLLQSTVAALEQAQSPEQFRENVEALRGHYRRIAEVAAGAQQMDALKARIGTLQSRPQTPELQAQLSSLHDRMYREEDKLWARLDGYETEGAFTATGAQDDPLSVLTPEQRQRYGLE